jgi:hypothetical protein
MALLTLVECLAEAKTATEPTGLDVPEPAVSSKPATTPPSLFPYYETLASLSGMSESHQCDDKFHVKAVDKLMFAAHALRLSLGPRVMGCIQS